MTFTEYLSELPIFFGLIVTIILVALWYTFHRVDYSMTKLKEHFAYSGAGAWEGIIGAAVAVLVLTLIAWLFIQPAQASEYKWFDETVIYGGIDYTKKPSPLCWENDVDDRMTSNLGFRQNIVKRNNIVLGGQYTHHSCVTGRDKNAYDAYGVFIEWRFQRQ